MNENDLYGEALCGKCFVIFIEDKCWNQQGHVKAYLGGGNYLIQFFSALTGDPHTMAVVPIEKMMGYSREPGSWIFFEDDEQLRDWIAGEGNRPWKRKMVQQEKTK